MWICPSPERLINRRALIGEELRAAGGNVKTILQTNAELAIDHDRWFVAKAHARLNRCLVATHKVRPFVPVEPDAVTRAMRQPRSFVVGTKACVGNDLARGRVHGFARRAHLGGGKAGVLRLALDFPNVALALRRFAENESAGDVGLVTFARAAVIHQNHIAVTQDLRGAAAVRKRGVLAKAAKDLALHPKITKRRGAVAGEFLLRHALAHRRPGRAIRDDREVVCFLHQSDLSLRFEHATTGGDRSRADKLEPGRCLANAIVEKKAHPLLDTDPPRTNAAIADDLRDAKIRALVFFPGANVGADLDQFARAFFFELGTNPGEFTALRDDQRKHALTLAPTHAGEVVHAGPRLDVDGVDFLLGHQALRFRDPRFAFVVGDRH